MFSLHRILVPTDFSPCAEQALVHAAFLARGYDAALTIAHIIPVAPGYPMAGVKEEETEHAGDVRNRLYDLAKEHDLDDLDVDLRVERGRDGVGAGVLAAAEEADADLITLGTHGRQGVRRLFLGSEAEEVIRGADRPVLAVRQQEAAVEPSAIARLLVPVDLSEHSTQALNHAVELARRYDADLHLLHIVQPGPNYDLPGVYQGALPPQTDIIDALTENAHTELDELIERAAFPAERMHKDIRHGNPAAEILDAAEEEAVDMIALASHGRSGVERFLMGSVAEKVIRAAPVPVFVVKAYGTSLVSRES
jgi:nucleotide-binding universal stress UspA family protein